MISLLTVSFMKVDICVFFVWFIFVVYESFDEYVAAEILDEDSERKDDESLYREEHAYKKRVTFVKFPPVLHLHLIRFQFNPETHLSHKCNVG